MLVMFMSTRAFPWHKKWGGWENTSTHESEEIKKRSLGLTANGKELLETF